MKTAYRIPRTSETRRRDSSIVPLTVTEDTPDAVKEIVSDPPVLTDTVVESAPLSVEPPVVTETAVSAPTELPTEIIETAPESTVTEPVISEPVVVVVEPVAVVVVPEPVAAPVPAKEPRLPKWKILL